MLTFNFNVNNLNLVVYLQAKGLGAMSRQNLLTNEIISNIMVRFNNCNTTIRDFYKKKTIAIIAYITDLLVNLIYIDNVLSFGFHFEEEPLLVSVKFDLTYRLL